MLIGILLVLNINRCHEYIDQNREYIICNQILAEWNVYQLVSSYRVLTARYINFRTGFVFKRF